MTGRELIMYILENRLEDEPVFQNGAFVGYMTDMKFAETLGVGLATIRTWMSLGYIKGAIIIGDITYIPINCGMCMAVETETKGSDDKCKRN